MRLRGLGILAGVVLLAAAAFAQMQDFYSGYLDVGIVKVKPEKRAEFDALGKKIADANRKNKGDTWLAAEVTYGEGNVVQFTSFRQNYADIDKGMDAFMSAISKTAGGAAGFAKMMQDVNNCTASSRAEVRRRRGDLSVNPPTDAASYAKMVGETRWVRTAMVRIRPGHLGEYEELLKTIKAAREREMSAPTTLVSQSAAGQQGTVFYLTTLAKSMADFDATPTPLPKLLGQEGFQKYLKTVSEAVIGAETIISRILPELSNPPADVAAAAPDFWHPKPAVTMKAKPKATEAGSKTQ
ncbi:MAG: hypothetical protein HY236_06950 [Acidobacteria bacterium]|nr:hypothetical protein [Acidobacteriota bacterium]